MNAQGNGVCVTGLFEEMRIGTLHARNRAVRAATAESLCTKQGRPTSELVERYRELACGGVGTIITGYAYVSEDGKPSEGALGLHDDGLVADLGVLCAAVHEQGACIVAQLVYGGSKGKLAVSGDVLGPSPVEHPATHVVPRQAGPDDLARLRAAFASAAARAYQSGFDGVEVHVAHGYLLSQFLSSRFNLRDDEYGGSIENRTRFAAECVSAVRAAVPSGFPVLAKINSCDVRDDPTGESGGLSERDSALAAGMLVDAGADCIDVSGDWHAFSPGEIEGEPFFGAFGRNLASSLGADVIVTGGWRDLDTINRHLAEDGIAGVALCRPLVCEPSLIGRWEAGDIRRSQCRACGNCFKAPGVPCSFRR